MNDLTAAQLIQLNAEFYGAMAAPFDRSRKVYQPGFALTLDHLPEVQMETLDIGCGNGRYGLFLAEQDRLSSYIGVDLAPELLDKARELLVDVSVPVQLVQGDMAKAGFLDPYASFDLIVCLSAMQHLPQRHRRVALLQAMQDHLAPGGHILLGNWQFNRSERQVRKIRPWSEIGLSPDDVESKDFLLTWQRGGFAYRYVCLIDEEETADLAEESGLLITNSFFADGREGDLNLYSILKRPQT